MSANLALAGAALSGTVQLLTFCFSGAYLASRNILSFTTWSSWSRAIYNVFLPCLLFVSIMETFTEVDSSDPRVYFRALWALVVLSISASVAYTVTSIWSNLEEGVKRVVFIALLLGNANNLPILLIKRLCDNFDDLRDDETCSLRGTGYVAMYLTAWNTLMVCYI